MSGISDRTCIKCHGSLRIQRLDLGVFGVSFPPSPKHFAAFAMPPKKVPVPSLKTTEKMLLLVAARVDTAIRYMEANPCEDDGHYMACMSDEVVSNSYFIIVDF